MGDKRESKKLEYWTCMYCRKRYSINQLEEGNYIEHTKVGDVVECPKCEAQQMR